MKIISELPTNHLSTISQHTGRMIVSNRSVKIQDNRLKRRECVPLAGCLIYARALLEYVIIIMWLRSVIKMLRSVKFAEDKVLIFLILHEKC